jgi:hypothetical protein
VAARGRAPGAAAAALLASGMLLGCGGGSPSVDAGGADVGAPISIADCTDWKGATTEQRLGTVRQLREFAGGPSGSAPGHGAVLDDKQAYDLFENACGHDYARAFKLYKLYQRAASFVGH